LVKECKSAKEREEMGEFWIAVLAGVAVSLWNKFVVNGGWRTCYEAACLEERDVDDSSTSSTISLDVHTHT
jgi:hypothetical protein